jgi:flagellar basal-body rod modification protein FlgD
MIFDNYSQGSTPTGEMGKQEFLQMLVAQLRHQDPLSPMESQQFASQLAEFSSLEELSNIDDSVSQGVDVDLVLTQAINNTLATTLIGKNVLAYGDRIVLDNSDSVDYSFNLAGSAEEVEVTIYDENGTAVQTISMKTLSEGNHTFSWDGKNKQGERLPEGNYTFDVTAKDSDGNLVVASTISKGLVSAVKYQDGIAVLIVNGKEIKFSDVLEIG